MLKAIAEGRGELLCGRIPSLTVDGRWCDFTATYELFTSGLFCAASQAASGALAPAVLTASGTRVLSAFV